MIPWLSFIFTTVTNKRTFPLPKGGPNQSWGSQQSLQKAGGWGVQQPPSSSVHAGCALPPSVPGSAAELCSARFPPTPFQQSCYLTKPGRAGLDSIHQHQLAKAAQNISPRNGLSFRLEGPGVWI